MWAMGRIRSSPAWRAAVTSPTISGPLASPGRGRVGSTEVPLVKSRSPFTTSTQSRMWTERKPMGT